MVIHIKTIMGIHHPIMDNLGSALIRRLQVDCIVLRVRSHVQIVYRCLLPLHSQSAF